MSCCYFVIVFESVLTLCRRKRRWDEPAPTDPSLGLPFSPGAASKPALLVDPVKAAREAADRINQLLSKKTEPFRELVQKEEEKPNAVKETLAMPKSNSPSKKEKNEEKEEEMLPSQYLHIKDPLFDDSEAYFRVFLLVFTLDPNVCTGRGLYHEEAIF